MSRRRFLSAALGAGLLAVAPFAFTPAAQAAATLKLAHASSESSLIQQAVQRFADEVAAKTGGSVEIQIFPAGQLGDEGPIAEGVGAGSIDIGLGGVIDTIDPKLGVITLPFLFKDFANVHAVLDGPFGQKLLGMGADRGYKMLGFLDSGFRDFSNSSRAIASPDDMVGLKLRTPPNPVILETIKQLGALPQSIPFGEVYTALQSHVVDGAEPELRDFIDQKWYEVQKYLTLANYIWTPNYWFMNADTFESLSAADQAALTAAVADTTAWYRDQLGTVYTQAVDTVKAAGVTVDTVDIAPFQEKVGPVYEKFSGEFGADLVAEVRAAAAAAP
jgi:tripartite ATP-independent transporter DctP family solute receptor